MTPSKATILDWRDQRTSKTIAELRKYAESIVPEVVGSTIEETAMSAMKAEGARVMIRAIFDDICELPVDKEESQFLDTSKD
jgi:hypothetical protein